MISQNGLACNQKIARDEIADQDPQNILIVHIDIAVLAVVSRVGVVGHAEFQFLHVCVFYYVKDPSSKIFHTSIHRATGSVREVGPRALHLFRICPQHILLLSVFYFQTLEEENRER